MQDTIPFDQKKSDEFHKDRWNRKWGLGLYFSAFHELGTHLNVVIGFQKKGEHKKWYIAPHALHDGRSAIERISFENKYNLKIPALKLRPIKSKVKAVFSLLRSEKKIKHNFVNQKPFSKSTKSEIYQFSVPFRQGNNSILINSIAKVMMKYFLANIESKWMIPVKLNNKEGLNASYLALIINKDDSVQKTQDSLRQILKSGKHWSLYMLSKVGIFIGKPVILKATQSHTNQKQSAWAGSISHLGNLGQTNLEEITVIAPVRWHRPLGAALYQLNNNVNIVLTKHESLPHADMAMLADEIQKLYLNASHK